MTIDVSSSTPPSAPEHRRVTMDGVEYVVMPRPSANSWTVEYHTLVRGRAEPDGDAGLLGDGFVYYFVWCQPGPASNLSARRVERAHEAEVGHRAVALAYPEQYASGARKLDVDGNPTGVVLLVRCPDPVAKAFSACGIVPTDDPAAAADRFRGMAFTPTQKAFGRCLAAAIDAFDDAEQTRWAMWLTDPESAAAAEVVGISRRPR